MFNIRMELILNNGIEIKTICFDRDLLEVLFSCSNGYFSGQAKLYLNHDDLSKMADALSGFSSHASDGRDFELGAFDPPGANGGVWMHFYCRDSTGHPAVEVRLRGDDCRVMGEVESVALRIPIEAAAVDSFIAEIRRMKRFEVARAFLKMESDLRESGG